MKPKTAGFKDFNDMSKFVDKNGNSTDEVKDAVQFTGLYRIRYPDGVKTVTRYASLSTRKQLPSGDEMLFFSRRTEHNEVWMKEGRDKETGEEFEQTEIIVLTAHGHNEITPMAESLFYGSVEKWGGDHELSDLKD